MSAMKNLIHEMEDLQDAVDGDLQGLGTVTVQLANTCWTAGNTAVAAPSMDWIQETKTQLNFLQRQLQEIEDARLCLDYDR